MVTWVRPLSYHNILTVITITFTAYGEFEALLAEDLLVFVRTVLAAAVAVEDAYPVGERP